MDASVIVPLYVYPSLGAWDTVFDMAASYPQMQFTAVVNVNSGPGEGALPMAEYSHAIHMLNSFANVRTVGYIATTWCARNLTSVLDDVAAYSFWGEYDEAVAIDGIFIDETPTQYSPDNHSYLQAIAKAVHESDGLKEGYIVHNPGALPDSRFFENVTAGDGTSLRPDMTIVFEDTFLNWSTKKSELAEATAHHNRGELAVVVHSVPELSTIEIANTLLQLLAVGHSIWFTWTSNYTQLDAHFPTFIDCLAALLR
ncbi:Spherulation-specific family 4 [Paraphoma chrysanthemicola]|uniref:Spherulation-specific family 4 n=1 Tax=Paraphoma chrysanthemicola TaxID=798071 RepID=A0A8K0VXN3_9PLEO|nr:Spherulation-specific family 4 [Paraphoma chrysanthemicola]